MQYDSRIPIYLQVIDHIRKRLLQGGIQPGEKLPSTRALALEYGVNPNTAARIYDEMEAMGLCRTQRGLGTFVTGDPGAIERIRRETAARLTGDYVREMSEIGFAPRQTEEAVKEVLTSCGY